MNIWNGLTVNKKCSFYRFLTSFLSACTLYHPQGSLAERKLFIMDRKPEHAANRKYRLLKSV